MIFRKKFRVSTLRWRCAPFSGGGVPLRLAEQWPILPAQGARQKSPVLRGRGGGLGGGGCGGCLCGGGGAGLSPLWGGVLAAELAQWGGG